MNVSEEMVRAACDAFHESVKKCHSSVLVFRNKDMRAALEAALASPAVRDERVSELIAAADAVADREIWVSFAASDEDKASFRRLTKALAALRTHQKVAAAGDETEQSIKADAYDMIAEAVEKTGARPTSIVEYVTNLVATPASILAAEDGGGAVSDSYIGWARYEDFNGARPTVMKLCDSDARGAFKIYASPPSQAGLREVGEEDARAVCDAERLHHTSVPRVLSVLQERFPNGVATGDSHGR